MCYTHTHTPHILLNFHPDALIHCLLLKSQGMDLMGAEHVLHTKHVLKLVVVGISYEKGSLGRIFLRSISESQKERASICQRGGGMRERSRSQRLLN